MDAGLYQQMEYAGRAQIVSATSPEERSVAFRRDLKLLVTLSGSILNFTKWTVVDDPDHQDRAMIEVSDAGAFPEALVQSTTGLMDCLNDAMGTSGLWKWDRPTPDLLRFRMTRSP